MVGYFYNPAITVTKAYLSHLHTEETNKLLLVSLIICHGLFKGNKKISVKLFTLKPFCV